jgi:hypothetical protein
MAKASKGSKFERDIARQLSLWWSYGKHDDWLWRVGGSGGRATNRAKTGKTTEGHYGDIVATCPEGTSLTKAMTFELKRGYNAASLQDILDKPNGPNTVKAFWEQVSTAAKQNGSPFQALIWQRDRREPLVFHNVWQTMHLSDTTIGDCDLHNLSYQDALGNLIFVVESLHAFCDNPTYRETVRAHTPLNSQ